MSDRSRHWDLEPVTHWLLSEGRFSDGLDTLSSGLAQSLIAAGVPLWRLRLGIRTLHPLFVALSGTWERDGGQVEIPPAPHGLETRSTYIGSPLEIIQKTGLPFRRDLRADLHPEDHIVLQELKDRGATDYFGTAMRFTGDTRGLLVFVCDHPDGFTDHDIKMFGKLADVLAPTLEVIRLKNLTQAIADAYLGPRSAARVMSGQITRGHVETIRAAILFSDIRGWTAINTRLQPTETIDIANRYFDLLSDAITAHGGEVLKLMGDGLLAIFPEEENTRPCPNALAAAQQAQANARAADGFNTPFGIAMHVGDVLYGNVGSARRLDFTVMGAAVNLAARIEQLCARYDRNILFSRAFAEHLDAPYQHVGTEPIKGIDAPQDIFAPL